MKLLRFKSDNVEKKGVIENNRIRRVLGNFFTDYTLIDEYYEFSEVKILPPINPEKIICVARNYIDHAKELNNPIPIKPLLFLKPPSSIIAHNEPINYPTISNRVEHEGELGVIIGKKGKNIAEVDAFKHILGYTCFNDITARDIQIEEKNFTTAKSFDTFAPIGPLIETELDINSAAISVYVNNQLKQFGYLRDMIFSIEKLISYISTIMTLQVGDVIATGTPPGVSALKKGDNVKVEISGLSTLNNYVV
ncbi:MAG: fumarylacetoacetate hydrolase family protein [Deferribacterota bacterium]|nr:fumarylacetoacetate hydrolase family protein [Deferribacterota bacterium]